MRAVSPPGLPDRSRRRGWAWHGRGDARPGPIDESAAHWRARDAASEWRAPWSVLRTGAVGGGMLS